MYANITELHTERTTVIPQPVLASWDPPTSFFYEMRPHMARMFSRQLCVASLSSTALGRGRNVHYPLGPGFVWRAYRSYQPNYRVFQLDLENA